MKNVQVFFSTRATARAAKFGKMTDNGSTAEKRWARTLSVTGTGRSIKKETLKCQSNRRCSKSVTVFYKGKIS